MNVKENLLGQYRRAAEVYEHISENRNGYDFAGKFTQLLEIHSAPRETWLPLAEMQKPAKRRTRTSRLHQR